MPSIAELIERMDIEKPNGEVVVSAFNAAADAYTDIDVDNVLRLISRTGGERGVLQECRDAARKVMDKTGKTDAELDIACHYNAVYLELLSALGERTTSN